MANQYTISPNPLTYDVLERASEGELHLSLSEEAVALIQKCRDYLDNKMKSQTEPIYGITTGFGSLCNRSISFEALSQLQENLVMSHACSTGTEVEPAIIRLMLFLKAHALSLGKSEIGRAHV